MPPPTSFLRGLRLLSSVAVLRFGGVHQQDDHNVSPDPSILDVSGRKFQKKFGKKFNLQRKLERKLERKSFFTKSTKSTNNSKHKDAKGRNTSFKSAKSARGPIVNENFIE
jgi:hypothetical protein